MIPPKAKTEPIDGSPSPTVCSDSMNILGSPLRGLRGTPTAVAALRATHYATAAFGSPGGGQIIAQCWSPGGAAGYVIRKLSHNITQSCQFFSDR